MLLREDLNSLKDPDSMLITEYSVFKIIRNYSYGFLCLPL